MSSTIINALTLLPADNHGHDYDALVTTTPRSLAVNRLSHEARTPVVEGMDASCCCTCPSTERGKKKLVLCAFHENSEAS